MKTIASKVFNRGVILLIGILVAILLFLSGFGFTNALVQKQSKTTTEKEVSLVQHYILKS